MQMSEGKTTMPNFSLGNTFYIIWWIAGLLYFHWHQSQMEREEPPLFHQTPIKLSKLGNADELQTKTLILHLHISSPISCLKMDKEPKTSPAHS